MITNSKNKFKVVLTKVLSVSLMMATVFTAVNCDDDDSAPAQQTVLEIAVANPDFDVLEAAAIKAGQDVLDVLGGTTEITVFAPTDAAFVAYLDVANEAAAIEAVNGLTPTAAADLLTFHVIAGSEIKASDIETGTTSVTTARSSDNIAFVTKAGSAVTINNGTVTTADVDASNGVIHIIDAVLTPPTGDIVDIATSPANAATFNILVASLTEANLVATLQSAGPFTVFAPTDDAFLATLRVIFENANLTEAQALDYLSTITVDSTPLSLTTLTEVLTYHVVSGNAYSINLSNNQSLTTVKSAAPNTLTVGLGATVTIDGSGSEPSTVIIPNISATNGVVHVIDKVLLF
jgi:uncharacterized surface protein with fasciclin (FAS1) repeats